MRAFFIIITLLSLALGYSISKQNRSQSQEPSSLYVQAQQSVQVQQSVQTQESVQAQQSVNTQAEQPILIPQITVTFLTPPTLTQMADTPIETSSEQNPSETTNPTLAENTPPENASSCSSPDSAGLSGAFEQELGIFLNNATATYGAQYSNLQYSISNQSISQDATLGTVSASYQGSVSEITTGETISASGSLTVNFSWDGCYWQLVDYSY